MPTYALLKRQQKPGACLPVVLMAALTSCDARVPVRQDKPASSGIASASLQLPTLVASTSNTAEFAAAGAVMNLPNGSLRLRGRVSAIQAATLPGTTRNWVVELAVDHVDAGEFGGKVFAFRIHSPSRAGLSVGQSIAVEATRVDGGFIVDELQWQHPPR
jgi:hypothetical protein